MRQSLDVKRGNPVRAPESATSRSSTDGMRGNGNQQSAERNRLIRLLPAEEYAWLQPHFKTVNLNVGDLLADEDEPVGLDEVQTGRVFRVIGHVVFERVVLGY